MPMYDQYVQGGRTLGHYAVGQRSGEIAATLAAAAHLARIRWTDSSVRCVLNSIRVGVTVSAAVTTATEFAFRAIIARQFTVDFSTNITAINLATTANTNKKRYEMGASLMGANGPAICTTVAMASQTLTADAAPFAIACMPNPSPTLGASAVTIQVGSGTDMYTLYDRTSLGKHPVVLTANEGVVIQNVLAGPGTGTFGLYVEWDWSEVLYI